MRLRKTTECVCSPEFYNPVRLGERRTSIQGSTGIVPWPLHHVMGAAGWERPQSQGFGEAQSRSPAPHAEQVPPRHCEELIKTHLGVPISYEPGHCPEHTLLSQPAPIAGVPQPLEDLCGTSSFCPSARSLPEPAQPSLIPQPVPF